MMVSEFFKNRVSLFDGLSEEQVLFLAQGVNQQSFKKGQTVLFKGSTVDGLHIVATGRVSVHVKPEKSAEVVKIAELGPGEVFGEISIVEAGTAGATVKCAEDDTIIFRVPEGPFRDLLGSHPQFQSRTQALIAERKAKKAAPPPPSAA